MTFGSHDHKDMLLETLKLDLFISVLADSQGLQDRRASTDKLSKDLATLALHMNTGCRNNRRAMARDERTGHLLSLDRPFHASRAGSSGALLSNTLQKRRKPKQSTKENKVNTSLPKTPFFFLLTLLQ